MEPRGTTTGLRAKVSQRGQQGGAAHPPPSPGDTRTAVEWSPKPAIEAPAYYLLTKQQVNLSFPVPTGE